MRIPTRAYWSLLATYLRPQRANVALLGLLMTLGITFELVNPQIIRSFIDTAIAGGEVRQLAGAALVYIGIALAQQAASVAATYTGERIGWLATNALRGELVVHCLRLDLGFHKAHTPGELIERIDGDVTALARFFSQFVVQVLGNGVLLLGALALLFREDWRVGLAMAVFVGLAIVVLIRIQAAAVPRWAAVRQASAELYGFLGEQLGAIEDTRANGAAAFAMHRFQTLIYRLYPLWLRAGLFGYAMWQSSLFLFALGTAAAFGLGGWLFLSGQISIGTVYLIFSYTELLRRPIENIRSELQDLQRAGASIVRVRQLLAIRPALTEGDRPLAEGALGLACEGVTFAYQEAEERRQWTAGIDSLAEENLTPVEPAPSAIDENDIVPDQSTLPTLSDINFELAPGMVLGLLGRTGSGKTTLARLLVRLYDPEHGTIRMGGTDLRATTGDALRRRVAMVTQDVHLFQATVRENLTLFARGIPDAQLTTVLEEIGLGAWLRGLPAGFDTELSGSGGLSAGEAQLLALARVFLRDPGLVIMDEASSRLDPATEQLLERAIDRLLRGRTAVIIAHRLATVQRADQIMILEQGRIVEYGRRMELTADPNSRFSAALRIGMEEVLA